MVGQALVGGLLAMVVWSSGQTFCCAATGNDSNSRFETNNTSYGAKNDRSVQNIDDNPTYTRFVTAWNRDWSMPSRSDGLTGHQLSCVDVPRNLTLCRNVGYSQMRLPNLLEHSNLQLIGREAASWEPLVNVRCHSDIQVFLCSLFAPICYDLPVWPCRSFCQVVRESCEPVMRTYGFPWPQMLHCDRFPADAGNLCIGIRNPDNQALQGLECSVCNHLTTFEATLDQFCRADVAIRLRISRLVVSDSDIRIVPSKRKILKRHNSNSTRVKNQNRLSILVDQGTNCSCQKLWNATNGRPSLQQTSRAMNRSEYLVMGNVENNRLRVSFLQRINSTSPTTARALSALKMDKICTTGIKKILQQIGKNKTSPKKKESKQKSKTRKAKTTASSHKRDQNQVTRVTTDAKHNQA